MTIKIASMQSWPYANLIVRRLNIGLDAVPTWGVWETWCEEDSGSTLELEIYVHRDAARAWQAVRDWLNGTPEQWQARAMNEYFRGAKIVYGAMKEGLPIGPG